MDGTKNQSTTQPTSLCDACKQQNRVYLFAIHQWHFFFSPDIPDENTVENKEENMAQTRSSKCQYLIEMSNQMYTVMSRMFLLDDHFVGAISMPWRMREKRLMDYKSLGEQEQMSELDRASNRKFQFPLRPRFALRGRVLLSRVAFGSQSVRFPLRDSVSLSEAALYSQWSRFALRGHVWEQNAASESKSSRSALRACVSL